jgi:hypothetical protein
MYALEQVRQGEPDHLLDTPNHEWTLPGERSGRPVCQGGNDKFAELRTSFDEGDEGSDDGRDNVGDGGGEEGGDAFFEKLVRLILELSDFEKRVVWSTEREVRLGVTGLSLSREEDGSVSQCLMR